MKDLPRLDQIVVDTVVEITNQFVDFVPRLLYAIIVLAIGWIIAKTVSFILVKFFNKIQIDKLGAKLNEIDFIKKFKTEVLLGKTISGIVYFFILLVFITKATELLGLPILTDLVASFFGLILRSIAGIILFIIGILVADFLQKIVVTACKSLNIGIGKLLGNIVFFFILVLALIAALGQAGINTSLLEKTFIVIIGGVVLAFSVGYGLASKDILGNMLSSFYNKNKFTEGQIIEVNGIKGEIVKIDTNFISLKTENNLTILPLNLLQTNIVTIFEK